MNLKRVKQHFIQVCASYGSLLKEEAMGILQPLCSKYQCETIQPSSLDEFIEDINKELNCCNHDISIIKYPITKDEFLVFRAINVKRIRFLNHLTEQDRNYLRLILMTIAVAENYGIPQMRTINLASQLPDKRLKKNRAEHLLKSWKSLGYLYESNEIIYLGPRLIVEFDTFLLKNFPETIKDCSLCKKIVLWDTACNHCQTKFHSKCIRMYLIKSSNCPLCQQIWNTSL